ncbi:uncharacterized protein LOC126106534 isoform X6 [Schistocerca cancellata]|uniref:uncharacterized protein LOC126106534 isoform X6 n=1 Tax=Schistocerca cancellata TaxID=274614 RepID=UPI0021185D94|nr:uncharacterized protein LOC126106534 isoform X6 [Schistocerca cancellata]
METAPEQHTSSACDAVTIKQEPVESEPLMSANREIEFISVKEEPPVEAEPHTFPKQEIEYISVKQEPPCLPEWEEPEGLDSAQDPLSGTAEECSPSEDFSGPSTSNIDKTENEEDEEEADSGDDEPDLKEESESINSGSEPESPGQTTLPECEHYGHTPA